MYITGYHGTTTAAASSIMQQKRFDISKGDRQWLGNGIYFYPDFSDALNWGGTTGTTASDSILHVLVKVREEEMLDMDTQEGKRFGRELLDRICKDEDFEIDKNAEVNQCALINLIWDRCRSIKVLCASFSPEKTKVKTLLDFRTKRKEFCVRDNDSIAYIGVIKRGDVK